MRALLAILAMSGAAAVAACVLVQPPQELPVPAPRRPSIDITSLQPPARFDRPITDIVNAGSFVVAVEAEPVKILKWRAYVDFGDNPEPPVAAGEVAIDPGQNPRRTFDFLISSNQVGDLRFCHYVTLFVAYDFIDVTGLPAQNDGDQVTWYYRPNGNSGACPATDAGVPDAAGPVDGAVE